MNGIWLASYLVLWILFLLLFVVVLGLVRQLGLIHLRLGEDDHLLATREGLEIGPIAPEFHGMDVIEEKQIHSSDLIGGKSVLVFIDPACHPCEELMPHLRSYQKSNNKEINILLFSRSDPQASLEYANAHQLHVPVIADSDGTIAQAYLVRATPFAYSLDERGTVRQRGIVNDLDGLNALLEQTPSKEVVIELPEG